MSRKNPTEVEQRELEFACHRCGADVGAWCETGHYWGGIQHPAADLHALRMYAALRAGRLPLEES